MARLGGGAERLPVSGLSIGSHRSTRKTDATSCGAVRQRVREWGYLAGIAIVALLIGAGALWLGEQTGMGISDSRDNGAATQEMPATDGMGGH